MPTIYIDADACPVKDEIIRVADRHALEMIFVSNAGLYLPQHPRIQRVATGAGWDAADNWIAERAGEGDIVITADILLAERCVKNKATVLGPSGKSFDAASIGTAVAMRSLNAHLRETGAISGNNPGFTKQDRSRFLQALENAIQSLKRRV